MMFMLTEQIDYIDGLIAGEPINQKQLHSIDHLFKALTVSDNTLPSLLFSPMYLMKSSETSLKGRK